MLKELESGIGQNWNWLEPCKKSCITNFAGCQSRVVLLAAFTCMFIIGGVSYSAGALFVQLLEEFQESRELTSWISSVQIGMFFGCGPLGSMLTKCFSCRTTVFIGGLLLGIGFVLSYFATSVYYLIGSIGIIGGLGCSFVYVGATVIPGLMLSKHKTFGTGIVFSGVCAGQLAYPFIYTYIIKAYGLRGSMLILSGLNFHICVCASLMWPRITKEHIETEEKWNWIVIKDLNMIIFYFSTIAYDLSLVIISVHLPAYGLSLGLDQLQAASLLSLIGASEFIGRILIGFTKDSHVIPTISICTTVCGLSNLMFLFCQDYWQFVICAGMYGLTRSTFSSLSNSIIIIFVGLENMVAGVGCSLLAGSLSVLFGGPVAGWIYDSTQSYSIALIMGGVAIASSGMILLIPWWRIKSRQKIVSICTDEKSASDLHAQNSSVFAISYRDHVIVKGLYM